jgi:hypothetical protein
MTDSDSAQITVLVPTYRRPGLLARALTSVIEQDGPPTLIRVFDNCSGDATASVVAAFAARHPCVEYRCQESNLGAARNFEAALASVRTPYFSFLSDDDYLLPGFHRRAHAALERTPEAAFWAGITLMVDEQATIWDARVLRWPREGLYTPPEGALAMTGGLAPIWTGILFRQSALVRCGPPDFLMYGPSDLDYLLRLASSEPFLLEKFPAAVFMLNADSYSSTQPLSSFWPGWIKMIANAAAMPKLAPADRGRLVDRLHGDARRMLFRRGLNAVAAGRLDYATEAASHLREHYSADAAALTLRALASACGRLPGVQALARTVYRRLEQRMVAAREPLHRDYAHLLRRD